MAVITGNMALNNFIVAKVEFFFIWLDLINKTLSLYGLHPFLVSWFLWLRRSMPAAFLIVSRFLVSRSKFNSLRV